MLQNEKITGDKLQQTDVWNEASVPYYLRNVLRSIKQQEIHKRILISAHVICDKTSKRHHLWLSSTVHSHNLTATPPGFSSQAESLLEMEIWEERNAFLISHFPSSPLLFFFASPEPLTPPPHSWNTTPLCVWDTRLLSHTLPQLIHLLSPRLQDFGVFLSQCNCTICVCQQDGQIKQTLPLSSCLFNLVFFILFISIVTFW